MTPKRKHKAIPKRITSCIVCGSRGECLRASHLWGVRKDKKRLQQVIDEIRYNRSLMPSTQLEEGLMAHELLEKQRSVVKDLDYIIEEINNRSSPFYMTATFCSPTFGGLRCQPDAVRVETTKEMVKFLIIEDKTSNQPRYYAQLYAEAVVLTDIHCLVAPAISTDHYGLSGRMDQRRLPFFPKLKNFETFIVEAALNPYGSLQLLKNKPKAPIQFSENFHMLPGIEQKYFIVTQSRKAILRALKHPEYLDIEPMPQMKFTRRGNELKLFIPKRS